MKWKSKYGSYPTLKAGASLERKSRQKRKGIALEVTYSRGPSLLHFNEFSFEVAVSFWRCVTTWHLVTKTKYRSALVVLGWGAEMAQSRQIFREKICEIARFWTLNTIPKYLSGSSLSCRRIWVSPLMDDRRLPHKIENKIKIKCAISSGWLLPYPSNALPFLFLRASQIPSAFFQLTGCSLCRFLCSTQPRLLFRKYSETDRNCWCGVGRLALCL